MIKINTDEVFQSASDVRAAAETMENVLNEVNSAIVCVEGGWSGAGAEQYLQYLAQLKKDVSNSIQRLNSIAESLVQSANAAIKADEESSKMFCTTGGITSVKATPPTLQNMSTLQTKSTMSAPPTIPSSLSSSVFKLFSIGKQKMYTIKK